MMILLYTSVTLLWDKVNTILDAKEIEMDYRKLSYLVRLYFEEQFIFLEE